MARPYSPRVNRCVTYFDATGKPKPGITTAVVDATHINLRIDRVATVSNVARAPVDSMVANIVSTWRPA